MDSHTPRILIFGGGAVGGFLACKLSHAIPGNDVYVACRSNFEEASKSGFVLHSDIWAKSVRARPSVVRSAQEASLLSQNGFDFVIVATKTTSATPSISEQIRPAVSPSTTIVVVQNGIQVEEEFHNHYPHNTILSVVSYVAVTQTRPGSFHHRGHGTVHLGIYPSTCSASQDHVAGNFATLLNNASIETYLEEDIQIERWSKLLVNMENPICALSRLRDVQYFNSAEGATESLRKVMEEVACIARAAGYSSIDSSVVERSMDFLTARKLPGVEPSTMADALASRSMEVEALVGNVLRLARKHEVDSPRIDLLYHLLNGLNESFLLCAKTSK